MKELLNRYKEKKPEIVFEWYDEDTGAEGWVVINSLRGGAAGGGTRMRKGLTKSEVVSLAKVMEVKFSVCGPSIGGAKSGINFDPTDPRKKEVLYRWYQAIMPLLKNYYGTGGDLNIDEVHDVIPITESYGLWHPQEGIVRGHLKADSGNFTSIIGQLRKGVSKVIENKKYVPSSVVQFTVADMITGYGVAMAVKHYYDITQKDLKQKKRAIIQGWGNVAAAAAFYLSELDISIVGIIDLSGGLIKENGFTKEELKQLFLQKKGNKLVSPNLIPFDEVNQNIWSVSAEIFIPGAASKIVSRAQLEAMIASGLELISCGANVPFTDDDIFFGPTAEEMDNKISIIPDFIANCGMARVFAYLMQAGVEVTDEAIFEDVSNTIKDALLTLGLEENHAKGISTKALERAIKKLV
jgi:glutamate dehydrogenase/leucine dehydrogenase